MGYCSQKLNDFGTTLYFIALDLISSGKTLQVSFEVYDKESLSKKFKEVKELIQL